MVDRAPGSRTYPPTSRRLRLLRQRGDVAGSREFNGICVLIAAAALVGSAGAHAVGRLGELIRTACTHAPAGGDVWAALGQGAAIGGEVVAVFFGAVLAAAALAAVIQVGPRFASAAVTPDFARLVPGRSPAQPPSVPRVLLGALKVIVIATAIALVCAWRLREQSQSFAYVVNGPPPMIGRFAAALLVEIAVPLLAVLAVLGLLDVLYVKWSWWARHHMTRGEVLADFRAEHGDPRGRRVRLRLHREMVGE